jgi:hypothetical protein
MKSYAEQTVNIFDRLSESAQISVLRFASFLLSENEQDVSLYDDAKANDDGYRVSSSSLREKYGV